jgi:hypothetical protein
MSVPLEESLIECIMEIDEEDPLSKARQQRRGPSSVDDIFSRPPFVVGPYNVIVRGEGLKRASVQKLKSNNEDTCISTKNSCSNVSKLAVLIEIEQLPVLAAI